jgi:hypothetical protein
MPEADAAISERKRERAWRAKREARKQAKGE